MIKEILKLIEMMVPLYGDIKIHQGYSKLRTTMRQELQDISSAEKQLDEREHEFRRELSDLLRKYSVIEEMGSYASFPSRYVAAERANQCDKKFMSTRIPEIGTYVAKYAVLITVFNNFSR